jgi:hypothetical protein
MRFALFARKQRNQSTTSLSITTSLLGFRSFSRSGLVFMSFNLDNGRVQISNDGGADCWRDQLLNVRPWHHSPWSPCGSFGMRGTWEFSVIITPQHKALASLTLLTMWEPWNERNTRFFYNKHSSTFVILHKIKGKDVLWELASANRLGEIMPGE